MEEKVARKLKGDRRGGGKKKDGRLRKRRKKKEQRREEISERLKMATRHAAPLIVMLLVLELLDYLGYPVGEWARDLILAIRLYALLHNLPG